MTLYRDGDLVCDGSGESSHCLVVFKRGYKTFSAKVEDRNKELLARIDKQQAENKKLKRAYDQLCAAFSNVEAAMFTPELIAEMTQDVGAPVTLYDVDCNEERVIKAVRSMSLELFQLRRIAAGE